MDFPREKNGLSEKNNLIKKKSISELKAPQPYLSPTCTWGDAAEDRGFPSVLSNQMAVGTYLRHVGVFQPLGREYFV